MVWKGVSLIGEFGYHLERRWDHGFRQSGDQPLEFFARVGVHEVHPNALP